MTTVIQILTAVALVLSIVIPFTYFYLGKHNKTRYKKSLLTNCLAFFGILAVAGIVTLSGASTASAAAADGISSGAGMGFIGAALSVGLSGIGSGIGVASSASAALGAISEDGSIFGKSLIFVAMAEGIALYGLIISFMIIGQL
ncbi:MAG TPA: ATPase [Candidatus Scatomonas merdavium]|nr:ATPase [Candidatus Scatomonas merdavium]